MEAQQLRYPLAADGESGGSDGGGTHGAEIHVLIGAHQPLHVAPEVLEGAHVEVPQRDGLRLLGMVGIGGDDGVLVHLCLYQQRLHQEGDGLHLLQQLPADVHSLNGRVHVVAGAAGVHLAAHLNAHLGDDPLLHVGVQIGQTRLMGHDVRPLPAQLQNSAEDLGGILLRDDALFLQHQHMCQMIQQLIGEGQVIFRNSVGGMLIQNFDVSPLIGLVVIFVHIDDPLQFK